jgi:predicted site-specific integrase-resolvase
VTRANYLLPWSMKPHRIVLYARVSTKDKGQDRRNQLNQLRALLSKTGQTYRMSR